MKKEEDVFKKFHDSFGRMEGHFHILEQRIPVKLQMEYFKYSEELRKENATSDQMGDEEVEIVYGLLQKEQTTEEEKKHMLSTMAISYSIKAYRLLEDYVQHPDPTVADWAYMALMEARIALESEFSEEKQIYISTGMGGKDEKMRFYTLFVSNHKQSFQEYQRHVIDREFTYLLSKSDCEIERLTIEERYVELVFLIPIRADIKKILDNLVQECNQYGDFLSPLYTITNVGELSKEEVSKILNKDGDS